MTAFFQRWWREQTQAKQIAVKKLVKAGQLEFVNGGWCMHDEATTHYIDMIDQTTLGHRYIKEQFGQAPQMGWQIDPFGHSAVQGYLLTAESGKSIAMDFIFDLPRPQNGHDGIWTFIDRFSKQAHFVPVKKTAKPDHLARLFVAQIFRLHGMPETIVSDRDPRFTSLFLKAIWANIGMRLQFSSSFHPQTDGQSEIANSVVLDLLKSYISDQKTQWERCLPLVEFAYNNTIHSSTGKAPFEIVEGAMKVPPIARRIRSWKPMNIPETWIRILPRFVRLCRSLKNGKRRKKEKEKLSMRYYGLFQITEQIKDISFRLRLPDTWKIHDVFHVNLWKTFGDVPDDGEPDEQPEVEANEEILVPKQVLAHKA
ncbi:hypothetical protein L7F22_002016 [Adiantum nelumboides]|nr:hypothetical protein [Adiantum nelumboides]